MNAQTSKQTSIELLSTYNKNPDTRLRNQLVEQNLGLVRKVAHQVSSRCSEPFDDLVQVGTIGLIRAIERFELQRGYSFSSFAVPYIRGEMQHYLRDKASAVRTPRRYAEINRRGRMLIQEFNQENGHNPSDEYVAEHLNVSVMEWREVKLAQRNKSLLSLDGSLGHCEDESLSLGALLPDKRHQSFRLAEDERLHLEQALDKLEQTTRTILEYVFFHDLTQTEVAHRMELSPMTVSRRIKKGLRQMWDILKVSEEV
ncbi:MAG: sigma-70 family RNA polymerase sigma factor [Gemmatimonadaceae bacterium]|nr:sigma-70 family RNA polymerase sigma factor [Gloeobacterales cyanobacterium ES-bin-141]